MNSFILLLRYVHWHYGQAFSDMMNIWKDFFVFIYNFFSIHTLFSTLFSPWQRMNEGYGHGVDINAFFGVLVVNTIMRFVGAFIRSIVIIIGIVSMAIYSFFVIVATVCWIVLPAFLGFILFAGIINLFT